MNRQKNRKKIPLLRFLFALLALALPNASPAKNKSSENERDSNKRDEELRYPKKGKSPPNSCKVINENCMFAGFKKDGPPGKDLRNNCVEPLLLGGTVEGVHLIKGIIESCKTMKESRYNAP